MTCDSNQIGPFSQTLFMGASVRGFNSSIGWNGEGNQINISLVEDKCAGNPRLYYDSVGQPQITTNPDDFRPPKTGWPVFLQFGNFLSGGVLKSWEQTNDVHGGTGYNVIVTGATEIVRSVELIIGNYNGPTFQMPNLFNCYGYWEQLAGVGCPTDPSLLALLGYAPATGFGGAQVNDSGMPWNLIVSALQALTNFFSPLSAQFGGPQILFKDQKYFLDLSNLPLAPPFYRLSGDSVNLLDAIGTICDDAGLDYFFDFVYFPNGQGDGVGGVPHSAGMLGPDTDKWIKIYTVNRQVQPITPAIIDSQVSLPVQNRLANGRITAFIGPGLNSTTNSRGLELRNETVNSFLVGDNRSDIWSQVYNDASDYFNASIWPFWGLDVFEQPIASEGFNDAHQFCVNSTSWNCFGVGETYCANVGELRAAAAGQSEWLSYVAANWPAKAFDLGIESELNDEEGFNNLAIIEGLAKPADFKNTNEDAAFKGFWKWASFSGETFQENIDRLFGHIQDLVQQFFGKKFMVALPFICNFQDTLTASTLENWSITDGGWEDQDILGLAAGSPEREFFVNDEGKLTSFVAINNTYVDLSELSSDDYIQFNNYIYLKCSVDPRIYYLDNFNKLYPRAVITLPGPVYSRRFATGQELQSVNALQQSIFPVGTEETDINSGQPGSDNTYWGMGQMAVLPLGAAIPLRSNTLSYGPWIAGITDPTTETLAWTQGKCTYERDTSLNPWTYGNTISMNLAALALVSGRLTGQTVIETGHIVLPGAPLISLGNLLISGGPEVTNITLTVDENSGVTTSYQMATFQPKFAVFGKSRVDAIRQLGKLNQKMQRAFNQSVANSFKFPPPSDVIYEGRKTPFLHDMKRDRARFNRSSHEMFSATSITDAEDETSQRSLVVGTTVDKFVAQSLGGEQGWLGKAGCEMAGVFRGFDTDEFGTGGFATYKYTSDFFYQNTAKFYSKPQVPPVDAEEFIPITVETLNPFMNDGSLLGFGNASLGHDIEYVVRDGVYPLTLSVRDPFDNYGETYRAIALRGPLVIAGWGYDINNKPVPNAGNNSLSFEENWLRKPQSWKCGPLDVRWDDARGVWTAPTGFKLVAVKLCDYLDPGQKGDGIIQSENAKFDAEGEPLESESCCDDSGANKITVWNTGYRFIHGGYTIICYYDTTLEYYIPIKAEDPLFLVTITQQVPATSSSTTTSATIDEALGSNMPIGASCNPQSIKIINPLKQPILKGKKAITYATKHDTHVVLQAEFGGVCVITNVDCITTSSGDNELHVYHRTLYLQAAWSKETDHTDSSSSSLGQENGCSISTDLDTGSGGSS